jgi:hypothetical protein
MKSYRLVEIYRSFGEAFCLDIWDRRQRQRNVCELSTVYMVLYPRQEETVTFYFCVSSFLLRLFAPLFSRHPLSSILFSSILISFIYSFSTSTVSICVKSQMRPGHEVSQFQLQLEAKDSCTCLFLMRVPSVGSHLE